ncbi:MAG: peptide ABC transporter ATP-binding protein, partial [Gammaproteobacteria bacterium]|nr:peptide ABC transporter ATP-binding protein [Gammaproteobacteria bacterium]
MTDYILEVSNFSVKFPLIKRGLLSRQVGEFTAVNNVSFSVQRGSSLGIVGESGSGKTTLVRAILRAIDPASGSAVFQSQAGAVDLCQLSDKELIPLRTQMQMIFQDPFASLNPRMKVADIVSEPLVIHRPEQHREHRQMVVHMLERVGLEADTLHRFPHAFSGGQRQ